jgi:hypothetical protein
MTSIPTSPASIRALLTERRFETARRQCVAALATASGAEATAVCWLLHDALCWLGDLPEALAVVQALTADSEAEQFAIALAQGEDYQRLSAYDFFRGSWAEREGLTGDEYADRMIAEATTHFQAALALATDTDRLQQVRETLTRRGRKDLLELLPAVEEAMGAAPTTAPPATGSLQGILTDAVGQPVSGVTVTLGLPVAVTWPDPGTFLKTDIGYRPPKVEPEVCTTQTDADGHYTFNDLPSGTHTFLAVTLDADVEAIPTRFLARDLVVAPGESTRCDAVVTEWASAPALEIAHPFPDTLTRDGRTYQRCWLQPFTNRFYFTYPRQLVSVEIPALATLAPERLVLLSAREGTGPAVPLGARGSSRADWITAGDPPGTEGPVPLGARGSSRADWITAGDPPGTEGPVPSQMEDQNCGSAGASRSQGSAGASRSQGSAGASRSQDFQVEGTTLHFFAEVPAQSELVLALYVADGAPGTPTAALPTLHLVPEADGTTAVLATGRAAFRLPTGQGTGCLPPLLAVRGDDGVWRGQGRFCLPEGVTVSGPTVTTLVEGPLVWRARLDYTVWEGTGPSVPWEGTGPSVPWEGTGPSVPWEGTGPSVLGESPVEIRQAGEDGIEGPMPSPYSFTLEAHCDEPYLLVHECSPAIEGAAVEFSLREFAGGRGFLHWTPENGGKHWQTLTAEETLLARLQESVPWWVPPQGFGYAMTAGGLAEEDYIAVFTRRRGEWIDRAFAEIAQGPGDDHRELDWPFPEMVGSTISMITAQTDASGDAFFRFGLFDGERKWGVLVSTLARNDGAYKELSACQHKSSSPRLQELMTWHLDEPDACLRPHLMAKRDDLVALRTKRTDPTFADDWELIRSERVTGAAALRFAIEGDPAVAWRLRSELVGAALIYPRMILLGRDYGDYYSPVGARVLEHWAATYDLIAASGVFSPEDERLVRRFLLLMAHMFLDPDFMNWHYGARNANFEADRLATIGTIGLVFAGHPDAEGLIGHVVSRIARMLEIYCTPGSGKWYENPSCYYLQSLKCYGTLIYLLVRAGYLTLDELPRLKDFMRWAILLLMPACPSSYPMMRDGASRADYLASPRVRRIPPVGDHAKIGPWVPEHYALLASLYRASDPAFADLLLWAYLAGGHDGGYFGNKPLAFTALTAADLQPVGPQALESRRLEGFGAVLRDHLHTDREFYCLIKQGPGGYRFHRTEGSFILFAEGTPLVYDGGEAGETWRHSTLSFDKTHMPLAPGHVERLAALGGVQFVQGVHPVALQAGDPVFLSDMCNHDLVPVAFARYAEPNPADVRSFLWVRDSYLVVHDDLQLDFDRQTHWHLQVVAEGESGCVEDGWRFTGRFGTDLQVLLPAPVGAEWEVRTVPILEYHLTPAESFAMRHLRVSGVGPAGSLAVLRPLAAGVSPVAAQALTQEKQVIGVQVTGSAIDDLIFLGRETRHWQDDGVTFSGRYGSILRRPDGVTLALLAEGRLQVGDVILTSDGPAVEVLRRGDTITITAQGTGRVRVEAGAKQWTATLAGERVQEDW